MLMADQKAPQMQATLGLTQLTANAMALIAPGAFLWLTFFIQATTGVAGQPSTAPSMWLGIFLSLLLCLATAVSYAEISKLYPGTGSSYYYAEQAMLSKDAAFKYARVAKFIVGWGSHLYYWVYPGVMVAVTGVFCGYVVGFLYPNFMSGANPGPVFMALVAIVFSFFIAWIASKGAGASSAVNTIRKRWRLTTISSPPPRTAPSCATRAGTRCRNWTRPASRFPMSSHIPSRTRPATCSPIPTPLRSLESISGAGSLFRPLSPF
jgi:hypothetical protein